MVVLGAEVHLERGDLGGDGAAPGCGERPLVGLARPAGDLLLRRALGVDGAAVVAADVVALAVALGRVVALPELREHRLERHPGGLERHLHHLGVVALGGRPGVAPGRHPGAQGALVGEDRLVGARNLAVRVTALHVEDARKLAHAPLGAPETAHAEDDGLDGCVGHAELIVCGHGRCFLATAGEGRAQGEAQEQDPGHAVLPAIGNLWGQRLQPMLLKDPGTSGKFSRGAPAAGAGPRPGGAGSFWATTPSRR